MRYGEFLKVVLCLGRRSSWLKNWVAVTGAGFNTVWGGNIIVREREGGGEERGVLQGAANCQLMSNEPVRCPGIWTKLVLVVPVFPFPGTDRSVRWGLVGLELSALARCPAALVLLRLSRTVQLPQLIASVSVGSVCLRVHRWHSRSNRLDLRQDCVTTTVQQQNGANGVVKLEVTKTGEPVFRYSELRSK